MVQLHPDPPFYKYAFIIMQNNQKIGLINNFNNQVFLHSLQYINIDINISLNEFNKLKDFQDFDYIFYYDEDSNLYLKSFISNLPSIFVDFTSGDIDFRRKNSGKKQDIIKAIGLNNKNILDTTAGLCKDSFVLACNGFNVVALEQNPLIYNLTLNALNKAKNDNIVSDIVNNIQLININSINYLANMQADFDCIYLDPMFPPKTKSSLCKKEMQIFHNLAYYGDNEKLFNLAFLKTKNRVVVKRMKNSEYIIDKKPNYQIVGKTIRYDVYLKN